MGACRAQLHRAGLGHPITDRAQCSLRIVDPLVDLERAMSAPTAAGIDRTMASPSTPRAHQRSRRRAGADSVRTPTIRHGATAANATNAVAPWKPVGGQRSTTCTARAPVSAPRSGLGRRVQTPANASTIATSAGITNQFRPRHMTTAMIANHSSVPRGAREAAHVTAAANRAQ